MSSRVCVLGAGLAYKRLNKNRYEIRRHLIGGKSDLTFLADDLVLKREVVIKGFELDGKIDQALEEAQKICQFESEYIVVVYDHFIERGVSYHVTRYHPKGSLQDKLDNTGGGVLNEREVRGILSDLVEGMKVVHAKNILHTDLKPQNVVFSDKNAVIIDFDTAVKNNNIAIAYTAGYASPEQDLEEKLDKRSDIYSLGAIAYHCLTGKKPTKAIDRETHDHLEKLGDRDGASDFLKSIDKALNIDKSKRPESVTAWKNSWGKDVKYTTTKPKGQERGAEDTTPRGKENSNAPTVPKRSQSRQSINRTKKAKYFAIGSAVALVGTGAYQAVSEDSINPYDAPISQIVEVIDDKSSDIDSLDEAENLFHTMMERNPTEQQKTVSINNIAQGRLEQANQYAQRQQWNEVIEYAQQGINLGVDGNLKTALNNEIRKAKAQLDAIQHRKDIAQVRQEKDKRLGQKFKDLHDSSSKEPNVR